MMKFIVYRKNAYDDVMGPNRQGAEVFASLEEAEARAQQYARQGAETFVGKFLRRFSPACDVTDIT